MVDADAAQALALAVGADGFLRATLSDVNARTVVNASAVDSAISATREAAERIARAASPGGQLSATDLAGLSRLWHRLGASLDTLAGPRATGLFAPSHGHGPGTGGRGAP